jgi:hypothetical protein
MDARDPGVGLMELRAVMCAGCGGGEVSCFLRDVRDGGWKIGRGRDALELRATTSGAGV